MEAVPKIISCGLMPATRRIHSAAMISPIENNSFKLEQRDLAEFPMENRDVDFAKEMPKFLQITDLLIAHIVNKTPTDD